MSLARTHPILATATANACQRIISASSPGHVLGIVLVGSLARDEFTGYDLGDRIEAYSDIEFVVLTKNGRLEDERGIRATLANDVVRFFVPNRYAGFDLWAMTPAQFDQRNALFFVEARANGVLLYSDSSFAWPRIGGTFKEADPVDLREICLHRAINMLAAVNAWHSHRRDDGDADFQLQYSLSRNWLDLLTVYAAFRNSTARTYRQRLLWAESGGIDNTSPFSPSFLDDIRIATAHKLDPKKIQLTEEPWQRLCRYTRALRDLAKMLFNTPLPYGRTGGRSGMNYFGMRLYAFKLLLSIRYPHRFSLRTAFRDQKFELLDLTLQALTGFCDDDASSQPNVAKLAHLFGICERNQQSQFDILLEAARFHYPYLFRK